MRAMRSARRCAILCEPQTVTRMPSSSVVVESVRASVAPQTAQHVWAGADLRSMFPMRMRGKVHGPTAIGQVSCRARACPSPPLDLFFRPVSDSEDEALRKSAFSSADPPRNFTLSVGERIRALTIGAPAYATRKKGIEDLEERLIRTLVALHDTLVARRDVRPVRSTEDAAILRALHDKAATFDIAKLNAMIETHNTYYPMEANLPMDPRTGEYLVYGRRWVPEEPWTAARFVERARAVIELRDEG